MLRARDLMPMSCNRPKAPNCATKSRKSGADSPSFYKSLGRYCNRGGEGCESDAKMFLPEVSFSPPFSSERFHDEASTNDVGRDDGAVDHLGASAGLRTEAGE